MRLIKLLWIPIAVLIIFVGVSLYSDKVYSGTDQELSGWVWGEAFIDANGNGSEDPGESANGAAKGVDNGGIGWISLNSLNCDPDGDGQYGPFDALEETDCPRSGTAINYGVDIVDSSIPNSKNLEGYAWSDNYGWIRFGDFGRSDSYGYGSPIGESFPGGNGTYGGNARLNNNGTPSNLSDDFIQGWVRACSAYASGCTGAPAPSTKTGGWDGWISLKGRANTNEAYGVAYDTPEQKFKGYPWGGNVIGWLDFRYAAFTAPTTLTDGVCSTTVNECTAGTLSYDPVDNPSVTNWTCNGVAGGNPASCSALYECPDGGTKNADGVCNTGSVCPPGQLLIGGVCTTADSCPPGTVLIAGVCTIVTGSDCQLEVSNRFQNRTIVGKETDSCSFAWTVTSEHVAGGDATLCPDTGITCTSGTVTPIERKDLVNFSGNLPVGKHVITCTDSLTGHTIEVRNENSNTLPQCKLNPNYGEF